ncbi:hypothetical protein BN871_GM_00010 [Paenibacillus sp. P22]|nr:hypothetical protein BN871_GM_00010 [Paenibacillus sp. P22]
MGRRWTRAAGIPSGKNCSPQPLHPFQIQMVGRLVQQQQIGARHQLGSQYDPGLLPAGQAPERPPVPAAVDLQAACDLVDECIHVVSASLLEHLLNLGIADQQPLQRGRCQVRIGHPAFQRGKLFLRLHQAAESAGEHLVHRHRFVCFGNLRQISDARIPAHRQHAFVGRLPAGYELQQRRFAAAVAADQADLFSFLDLKGYAVQHKMGRVVFSYVLSVDDNHMHSSPVREDAAPQRKKEPRQLAAALRFGMAIRRGQGRRLLAIGPFVPGKMDRVIPFAEKSCTMPAMAMGSRLTMEWADSRFTCFTSCRAGSSIHGDLPRAVLLLYPASSRIVQVEFGFNFIRPDQFPIG